MVGIIVWSIVVPKGGLVVDVPDEHTVTWDVLVPACELAVFEKVVFAFAWIIEALGNGHDEGLVACGKVHQRVGLLFREDCWREPSQFVALVGAHACRDITVPIVATFIEQIIAGWSANGSVIATRIVEVGQSQDVGELVTEGAHAVHIVAPKFVGAGIVHEQFFVEVERLTPRSRAYIPGMGPDIVGVVGAVFSLSSKEGKDEVDDVVGIAVVVVEIDIEAIIKVFACLLEHLPGFRVFVPAIVFETVLEQNGAIDVKLRVELTA